MTGPADPDDAEERRLQQQYVRIFDLTPSLLCIARPDGFFDMVNPAWETTLGFSKAEIMELGYAGLIHPDDLQSTMAEVRKQRPGGATIAFVNRYRCKDGSYKTLEWMASPAVEGTLFAAATDITERKQAEEALRRSAELHRSLFTNMLNGMAYCRMLYEDGEPRDFVYLAVNEAFTAQTGLKDVVGRRVTEVIPGIREADPGLFEWYGRVARTGRPERRELFVSALEMWFSISVYSPAPEHFVAVFDVITERKRAEDDLRRSEADLKKAQAVAHVGSWKWHIKTDRLEWSDEMYRIFGLEKAGFSGDLPQVVAQSIHPDDRDAVERANRSVAVEKQVVPMEYRVVRPDGDVRTVWAEPGEILLNGQGEPETLNGVVQDITERKRAEAALANLQKLESLGTLAGGIAHDFNNILTAILGNLSLLRTRLNPEGEASEMFQEALDACGVAKGLAHQLLTFAKGGRPVVRVLDLRPALTQTAAFAARGSKARCVFELGDAPLLASVDKEQVAQVVQNLVINATQAMPEGGIITVQADSVSLKTGDRPTLAPGRYIRVRVADQGTGIPPEHLSKVFDPYFSTKAAGRGLGLAVCYSIMANHGGDIAVESQAKAGTVFTLHFPCAEGAAPADESGAPQLARGRGRVLVMDDEAPVAKVLTRMLESLGYQAESAADGKAALAAYRAALQAGRPYAAVIMDLTIPGGMGGKDAVVELAALDPEAKAIVSSGYADDPIMADHAAHGFAGVLRKPYRIGEVSEVLRSVLGPAPG